MGSASTDLHPLTRRTCFRAVGNHLHEFPCWLPAPRQSAAVRFGGFMRPTGMMPARSSPHCWPSCASGSPRRSRERRSLAVWLILKGSRTMGLSPGCYFIIPPPPKCPNPRSFNKLNRSLSSKPFYQALLCSYAFSLRKKLGPCATASPNAA